MAAFFETVYQVNTNTVSLVCGVWWACPSPTVVKVWTVTCRWVGCGWMGGRVHVWVCVVVGCTVLRATVTVSLFVVSWVNVMNGTPGGWFTHLTVFRFLYFRSVQCCNYIHTWTHYSFYLSITASNVVYLQIQIRSPAPHLNQEQRWTNFSSCPKSMPSSAWLGSGYIIFSLYKVKIKTLNAPVVFC